MHIACFTYIRKVTGPLRFGISTNTFKITIFSLTCKFRFAAVVSPFLALSLAFVYDDFSEHAINNIIIRRISFAQPSAHINRNKENFAL